MAKGLTNGLTNHGQYEIYLTGSKKNVRRNVYEDSNGKTWIVWGGQLIEVARNSDYYSVEEY